MSNTQSKSPPERTAPPERKERDPHPPARGIPGWIPVLAVIVFAALVVYIVWRHIQVDREQEESSKSAAQMSVDTATVKRDSKPEELMLPGDIQAYQVATLYARTNGYIKAWYKDIGAPVKEGDLIAEIEAPDVDAQLRQADANLKQAQANLDIAKLNFEREKDLLVKKVVSQQDFDTARTGLEAQEAAEKASEANLQNLEVQQGFQKIVAPFAGIVTRRNVDVGDLVSQGSSTAGTMLFSVAQSDPLRIFVNVPQTNATDIHEGMKAKVLVAEYPGRDFEGTVARTAGAIDPASRTLLTEVDIDNHDGALFAGMYGQVKFVLESKSPPLLIPANAFRFRTGGPQVAVVTGDGSIHWQTVVVGRDLGTKLELKSGLEENARVVINPTDDLTEGMKPQVKQQEEKPADKPTAQPAVASQDKTAPGK